MPLKVLEMPREDDAARERMVRLLEHYLAEAKAGKLRSLFVFANQTGDGAATWAWRVIRISRMTMLGALEWFKFELLRQVEEDNAEVELTTPEDGPPEGA